MTLVRHAQGIHKVEEEKNHSACLSYDFLDGHLTPIGWEQVHSLQKHHVQAQGLNKKIELMITSPLLSAFTLLRSNGQEGSTIKTHAGKPSI
ncbi:hypothetical protein MLD38_034834 [Melastoma candidum]|uniref:Uncharacterized protein n=1 Tax=Melastoma candidum TaxID=119954 RepID=A0ACB9MBR7_9MYRT|nr:hypothetical protein MLD38_034834 [Melastoma candidum]